MFGLVCLSGNAVRWDQFFIIQTTGNIKYEIEDDYFFNHQNLFMSII